MDTVTSNLPVTIATQTATGTYSTDATVSVTFVQIGRIVVFTGEVTMGSNITGEVNNRLFAAPSDISLPIAPFYYHLREYGTSGDYNGYCDTGAGFYSRTACRASQTYRACGCYVTAS